MKNILVMAANPEDTPGLQLNREIRVITDKLKNAKYRDDFEVKQKAPVTWDDFQQAILEVKPRIIHFCGHGIGQHGLVLEKNPGQRFEVPTEILADLFKQAETYVECVLMNACYSQVQAEAISQHINYVIGMKQAVKDDDAIAYTSGFYLALGARESIENAHNTGCREIRIQNLQTTSDSLERDLKPKNLSNINTSKVASSHLIPELLIKDPLTPFEDTIRASEIVLLSHSVNEKDYIKPGLKAHEIDHKEKELLLRIIDPFIQEIENRLRCHLEYWTQNDLEKPSWDCSHIAAYINYKINIFKNIFKSLEKNLEILDHKEVQLNINMLIDQINELLKLLDRVPNHRIGTSLKRRLISFKKHAEKLNPSLREACFRANEPSSSRILINRRLKVGVTNLIKIEISDSLIKLTDEAVKVSPFIS